MRFHPGAVAAWLGVPASELLGARLPFDTFRRSNTEELIESVGGAQEPSLVARRIETALAKIAVHLDSPDDFAKLILSCIAQPRNARRPITRELTSALGISERTPRRHCEYAFGYGPKTLDRVLRMQCYLKLARTNSTLGLTGLAAAAGYADQAHLSREARSLTGLTAKTLLAQLANRRGVARVHKTRRKRLRGSVFQWW